MKKIAMFLALSLFTLVCLAAPGEKIMYYSVATSTFNVTASRTVSAGNYMYQIQGDYYELLGAVASVTSDVCLLAIGSGSTTPTGAYTAKYEVVIPMKRDTGFTAGSNNNFSLDFSDGWYTQGLLGGVDNRGVTLNVGLRQNATTALAATSVGQVYLKLKKVFFSN
jgi:hypothetical protein